MSIEQYKLETKEQYEKIFSYMMKDMADGAGHNDIKMYIDSVIEVAYQMGRLDGIRDLNLD